MQEFGTIRRIEREAIGLSGHDEDRAILHGREKADGISNGITADCCIVPEITNNEDRIYSFFDGLQNRLLKDLTDFRFALGLKVSRQIQPVHRPAIQSDVGNLQKAKALHVRHKCLSISLCASI